jgi:hypothetical protein
MVNKDNQSGEIRREKNKQKRRAIGPPFLNKFFWLLHRQFNGDFTPRLQECTVILSRHPAGRPLQHANGFGGKFRTTLGFFNGLNARNSTCFVYSETQQYRSVDTFFKASWWILEFAFNV